VVVDRQRPWTGPAGLDADLARNGDGTFTMRMHASGRTLSFDYHGMLIKDADRNGNAVSFRPARLLFGDHRQPRRRGCRGSRPARISTCKSSRDSTDSLWR